MKKIKKSTIAVLVAGALIGGSVTYAGSTIFGNLDQIKDNFDFVFNLAKTNEQKAKELQDQINQSQLSQAEAKVVELLSHTTSKVNELTE